MLHRLRLKESVFRKNLRIVRTERNTPLIVVPSFDPLQLLTMNLGKRDIRVTEVWIDVYGTLCLGCSNAVPFVPIRNRIGEPTVIPIR